MAFLRGLWCLLTHWRHKRYIEDQSDPEQWAMECRKCGWDAGTMGVQRRDRS